MIVRAAPCGAHLSDAHRANEHVAALHGARRCVRPPHAVGGVGLVSGLAGAMAPSSPAVKRIRRESVDEVCLQVCVQPGHCADLVELRRDEIRLRVLRKH